MKRNYHVHLTLMVFALPAAGKWRLLFLSLHISLYYFERLL